MIRDKRRAFLAAKCMGWSVEPVLNGVPYNTLDPYGDLPHPKEPLFLDSSQGLQEAESIGIRGPTEMGYFEMAFLGVDGQEYEPLNPIQQTTEKGKEVMEALFIHYHRVCAIQEALLYLEEVGLSAWDKVQIEDLPRNFPSWNKSLFEGLPPPFTPRPEVPNETRPYTKEEWAGLSEDQQRELAKPHSSLHGWQSSPWEYLDVPMPEKCAICDQIRIDCESRMWRCDKRWGFLPTESLFEGPPPVWCPKVGNKEPK